MPPTLRQGAPQRFSMWIALLFAGAILLPAASPAQNADAQPAAEVPLELPKKVIEPIPASEIAVSAERDKRSFAELEKALEPTEAAVAVTKSLPDLRKRVEERQKTSDEMIEREPDVVNLEELTIEWNTLGREIDELQAQLSKRGKEIEEHARKIRDGTEVWNVTREAAVAGQAAPEIVAQVDEVLASANKALERATERQGAIVTLQSQVAQLAEARDADLQRIAEARDSLVGRVFQRDRAPVWHPRLYEPLTRGEIWERLKAAEIRDYEIARAYIERRQQAILLHLVLLVVLVVAMFAARRRIHLRAETDEGLAAVKAVFDSPISLSVLLVTLLAVWTFPDMPRALNQFMGLALLVPAVLILRRLLDPGLFPILNALVVLWVLDRTRMMLSPLPQSPRLVFLVEMLVLASIALWFIRPARLGRLSPEVARTRLVRVIGGSLRVALVVSLFSLVAEASGYSALAQLFGGAMLLAAVAAVVLYGAVRVVDGLVAYALRARPLRLLGMVQRHRWLIRRRVMRVVGIAAGVWWADVVLNRLEVRNEFWGGVVAVFSTRLPISELTFGDIALFFLTIWVTFQLSKFIRFALEEDIYTRVSLHKGQPYAVSTLTHYVIVTVGVLIAFAALGFDLNRFTLLAGAFGVGIGFGLQTIVNNFVSGLILLTERPVEVGDSVQLLEGNVFGEVQRIGIRSSTVRTWQGAEVIVPNADLVAHQVTNWTHSDKRRRIEVEVGVPYGTDPAWMLQVLLEVPKANPRILDEPGPYVLFVSFGDSALLFEVRCWTDDFDNFLSVKSEISVGIAEALKEVGVEIPFPQRDLHVKTLPEPEAPERPEPVPRERPRLARAGGTSGMDDAGDGDGD